jgi:hypothetical protein
MTDIAVESTGYTGEDRSWLLGPHGTDPGSTPSVTLDVTAFTVEGNAIPSGTVIGLITASDMYGPYDPAAADGTETAAGILFGTLNVRADQEQAGGAMLVHGFVSRAKIEAINADFDAAGEADLSLIHFS